MSNEFYIGIADGAAANWQFLQRHTTQQVLAIALQFYLSGFKAKIWISQFFLKAYGTDCHR
jgi:hypothetical protein